MVTVDKAICPKCGIKLQYYDHVNRILRTKYRETKFVQIRRLKCPRCGNFHRELPEFIFPYKQYDADIIRGVLDNLITSETLGFEDYPCELTMSRWKKQLSKLIT